jgi:kynurenine formamidase
VFIPALLISVSPEWTGGSDDLVITLEAIEMAINSESGAVATGTDKALIVRTLPNDDSKLTREYGDVIPPYFSTDAMEFIVECGFKHLLVDLPSIDRIFDEGKLLNHRLFWNVEAESFETNENTRLNSTITELIYVPNEVADSEYLLNLQIAPFEADASPSRPVLFKIT